jgi:hypothetical protein
MRWQRQDPDQAEPAGGRTWGGIDQQCAPAVQELDKTQETLKSETIEEHYAGTARRSPSCTCCSTRRRGHECTCVCVCVCVCVCCYSSAETSFHSRQCPSGALSKGLLEAHAQTYTCMEQRFYMERRIPKDSRKESNPSTLTLAHSRSLRIHNIQGGFLPLFFSATS